MYFIIEQIYNNLQTVMSLVFAGLIVAIYFISRSLYKTYKDSKKTWDPDKYRKY